MLHNLTLSSTLISSIGCALGFQLHCKNDKQYLPGRLPKSATHIFHREVYDCRPDASHYLFIVRDPLARSRSAFVYGRLDEHMMSQEKGYMDNRKRLYIDCPFQTINDLASKGLAKDGTASDECKQRAKDMLMGTVWYETHHYFSYQYYLEALPKDAKILVIRTEHLEEDWNDIEVGLGGQAQTNITFPRENSQPKQERDMILGEDERMLLCKYLCIEIQVYKDILRRAMNINDEQYEVSMSELSDSCPIEAKETGCSFSAPDISEKLKENRGYPNIKGGYPK